MSDGAEILKLERRFMDYLRPDAGRTSCGRELKIMENG